MAVSRLELALEAGLFSISGVVGVWNPVAGQDLSVLDKENTQIIQDFWPDYDQWLRRGFEASPEAKSDCGTAIVFLPRSKPQALGYIAQAAKFCDGPIVVDGQKTDGVDSILKACRARGDVSEAVSKSHGKLFVMSNHDGLSDWLPERTVGHEGFTTAPGVFSADKVDRGSRLLVDALPQDLGRYVADLGAGWGYLSRNILDRPTVENLNLVEASHEALECARINVSDPRARFFWADATTFKPDHQMDTVVSNPPFHTSRNADPSLGRAFIAAAAGMLSPAGQFYMVANRHLPYEAELQNLFTVVDEIGGDKGFKVIHASRPKAGTRQRR